MKITKKKLNKKKLHNKFFLTRTGGTLAKLNLKREITSKSTKKKYVFGENITSGSFGRIWIVIDESNKRYVLKEIIHPRTEKTVCFPNNELEVINFFECRNLEGIMKIIDTGPFESSHGGIQKGMYITEKYSDDIMNYIINTITNYDWYYYDKNIAKEICMKILEIVIQLHRNKIYHRDLKPSNILIFTNDIYKSINSQTKFWY